MPTIAPNRRVTEALAAHDRGWLLTPLHGKDGKIPYLKGWQSMPAPTREEVEEWARHGPVGVRTGVTPGPDGWMLVVVDPDTYKPGGVDPAFMAQVEALETLQATTQHGGRHVYVWAPPGVGNSAGTENKGLGPNIDVRGNGGQVVLVGADGYEWYRVAPVAKIPQAWLDMMGSTPKKTLAAASKKIREARPGVRNDTHNAVTFGVAPLVKQGLLSEDLARTTLVNAAVASGLERHEAERTFASALSAVSDAPSVIAPGVHANGVQVGSQAFVADVLHRIPLGAMYRRAGVLGTVVDDQFVQLDAYRMMALVDSYTRIRTIKKDADSMATCSKELAALVLSVGAHSHLVRRLDAIATHPVITTDGILGSGYHDGVLVIAPTMQQPVYSPDDLLCDFSWDEIARANNLGYWFGMLTRPLLRGCQPFFHCTAAAPGAGKTLLMSKIAGRVVFGRDIAVMQWPNDHAEEQKQLFAVGVSGVAAIVIDNLHEILDSPALASMLTTELLGGRVLGKSEFTTVPNRLTYAGTGNNSRLSGEMARRAATIELRSAENPSQRTGWRHERVTEMALEKREGLLRFLCEMAERYFAAGKPKSRRIMGGFEAHIDLVGGILHDTDYLGDELLRAANNEENDSARLLIEAWFELHGEHEISINDALALAQACQLYAPRIGHGNDDSRRIRMGHILGDLLGRTVSGLRMRRHRTGKGQVYMLERG